LPSIAHEIGHRRFRGIQRHAFLGELGADHFRCECPADFDSGERFSGLFIDPVKDFSGFWITCTNGIQKAFPYPRETA
jgi:hypothetical protein